MNLCDSAFEFVLLFLVFPVFEMGQTGDYGDYYLGILFEPLEHDVFGHFVNVGIDRHADV